MRVCWGKRLVLKTQWENWGSPSCRAGQVRKKRFSHFSLLTRLLRYAEEKLHLNDFSSFVAVVLEMRWGKRPLEESSSYWRQLLVHPPFLSPLPAEGQISPHSSTKLIRCNFSDRKLSKDVSRAGSSGRSSRLGPLKLKLNFIFPFPQPKEVGREEANPHPEGERGTLQVPSPPSGSPPSLGEAEHTSPCSPGREAQGWVAALEKW